VYWWRDTSSRYRCGALQGSKINGSRVKDLWLKAAPAAQFEGQVRGQDAHVVWRLRHGAVHTLHVCERRTMIVSLTV